MVTSNPDALQLTTWADKDTSLGESDTGYKYRYRAYDANGVLQKTTLAEGHTPSWGYKVVMTGKQAAPNNSQNLTTEQLKGLTGSKINLAVAASGTRERVWVTASDVSINDGANPTWTTENSVLQASVTNSHTLTGAGDVLATSDFANGIIVGYVGIYIDGGDSGSAENSPLGSLGFTVTITGTAAS